MDEKNFFNIPEKVALNFAKALDNPIELQTFRTLIHDNNVKEALELHKEEIVRHLIHSKFCCTKSGGIVGGGRLLYCMSGFVEQEGRMPTEDDEIRIFRGGYYFTEFEGYILSEIGFEIVRKKIPSTVRGDFVWDDSGVDTNVKFVEDPRGRFIVSRDDLKIVLKSQLPLII